MIFSFFIFLMYKREKKRDQWLKPTGPLKNLSPSFFSISFDLYECNSMQLLISFCITKRNKYSFVIYNCVNAFSFCNTKRNKYSQMRNCKLLISFCIHKRKMYMNCVYLFHVIVHTNYVFFLYYKKK